MSGTRPPADPSVLPAEFVERMAALLGPELEPFLHALTDPAVGVRANTLRLAAERLPEIVPFALEPLPFPAEGFRLADGARPGKHPYHAAGLYYLQDPGAMAVGALSGARPGERVIDLAAAPGGKSTHLAARMGDDGVLVANDVHPGRARELAGNLERMGVRRAVVTCDTPERLADRLGAVFHRVLLDAPCSGESMFHKSAAARQEWSAAAVAGCARRQGDLLRSAARLVRPGGVLLYSTCTFSPEENEGALARFLRARPDFAMEPLDPVPGAAPAEPGWAGEGGEHPGLRHALRLWPHRVPGAGHFVAALRRATEAPAERERRPSPAALPRGAERVARGVLEPLDAAGLLDEGAMTLVGEEVYLVPPAAPPLDGLHPLRPGWWIGTLRGDRLEPSHALAMALRPGRGAAVALTADDPRVLQYLRGEALRLPGEQGWVRVTVDGFALGWGKRVGETVKNHYPKGLRWR